jgi:predicted nuclease of predicted toxin-antitoxin system
MLRLVSDENFNGEIIRGLVRAQPDLDIVRVQDVGLLGVEDPQILAWAAENNRVLVTHDRATIPAFAYDRVRAGEPMPGVFVLDDRAAVGPVIEDLLLFALCSQENEWEGQVLYL